MSESINIRVTQNGVAERYTVTQSARGPVGATGATGATGPAGPAPSGTGLVSVTSGVLDTPSTLSARVAADAANLRTQIGLPVEVKNSNFTAENRGRYVVTGTCTVTDPASPSSGDFYEVFVRSGTATIGGLNYTLNGHIIRRIYHTTGGWASRAQAVNMSEGSSIGMEGTSSISLDTTSLIELFDGSQISLSGGLALQGSASSPKTITLPDASGTIMLGSQNLSGITNAATARTNLGATATGDALFTAASATSARQEISAQTSGTAFLERFGRFAESAAVVSGDSPEIGPDWFFAGSGAAGATVQNRALTAASGTLLYVGSTVPCPDSRFSITVLAEIYANPSYTSGSTLDDLTFGINAKPFDNLANFLTTPLPIHAQLRTDGTINGNIYTGASPSADDGTTTLGVIPPIGVVFPIRIIVEGNILIFSALGRTKVYRSSEYATRISPTQTGFFVEWSGGNSATQHLWRIHAVAANAWELESEMMSLCGEYGNGAVAALASRSDSSVQGRVRVQSSVAFVADMTPQAADSFAGPGSMMLGYAPYFRPGRTWVARNSGTIARGVDLLSVAPSTNAVLYSFPRMEEIVGYGSAQLAAGSVIRTTMLGQFGANANTKRIKITRSAGGADRFDSGDLTDNAVAFILEFWEMRKASAYRFMTRFTRSGQAPVIAYNADATGAVNQLLVTGTAAGDVTIHHHQTEVFYVP